MSADFENKNTDSTRGSAFNSSLGVLVLGIITFFGTFSPWVTVGGFLSVAGNKSEWGISTFLAALALIIYGLSGLLNHTQFNERREVLRKISIVVSSVTLLILFYLLYRYFDAVSQYDSSIADSQAALNSSDLGDFGTALDGMFDSLYEAIKPRIGIGYIACTLSLTIGLIVSTYDWRSESNKNASTETELDDF